MSRGCPEAPPEMKLADILCADEDGRRRSRWDAGPGRRARGGRGRLHPRAARRDRSRRGRRRDRARRRGHQLRRLDGRRRRRGARGRGAEHQPRRRPQRRRGRRHRRLRLERLRLRRHQGRAVPRVGPGQPAVGLRAHQARRRARNRGGQPAPPDRPLLLAVRRRRKELRGDDARARSRGPGRGRPGRLPDLHRPPRRGAGRARAQRGLRRPPPRRERLLLVVRVRPRDLRAGRLRHARRALHHRRVPTPGAAARVLRARQRARRPAAHLAAGPRCVPGGQGAE